MARTRRRYILDGFPRTFAEAYSLFALRDDAGDLDAADPEVAKDAAVTPDPAVFPGSVILLDAQDDVLEQRVGSRCLPRPPPLWTHWALPALPCTALHCPALPCPCLLLCRGRPAWCRAGEGRAAVGSTRPNRLAQQRGW